MRGKSVKDVLRPKSKEELKVTGDNLEDWAFYFLNNNFNVYQNGSPIFKRKVDLEQNERGGYDEAWGEEDNWDPGKPYIDSDGYDFDNADLFDMFSETHENNEFIDLTAQEKEKVDEIAEVITNEINEDGGMMGAGATPGMGNAVPASSAAMTGSQQASPSALGSGDKWDASIGKPNVQEQNINPYDKIGVMMAKKMKVPMTFEKGKNQSVKHVKQKDITNPKNHKYKHKVSSYSDYANLIKEKKKKKDESLDEAFRLSGVTYDVHPWGRFTGEKVYAGEEGMLGQGNIFIPWDFVSMLMKKYNVS